MKRKLDRRAYTGALLHGEHEGRRRAAAVGGARASLQGAHDDVVGAAFVAHEVAPAADLARLTAVVAPEAHRSGTGAADDAYGRAQGAPEGGDHVARGADAFGARQKLRQQRLDHLAPFAVGSHAGAAGDGGGDARASGAGERLSHGGGERGARHLPAGEDVVGRTAAAGADDAALAGGDHASRARAAGVNGEEDAFHGNAVSTAERGES
jgi:hypothetical protein